MIAAFLACALLAADSDPQTFAFSVESEIHAGTAANSPPVARWLTLFDGMLAIDSELNQPNAFTVYDFARGEITKLDLNRQKKSTISFGELENYVANIRLGLSPEAAKNFGAMSSRNVCQVIAGKRSCRAGAMM